MKVVVKRGRRVLARRTVRARTTGAYRVRLRIRGRGRVTVRVSAGRLRATARR